MAAKLGEAGFAERNGGSTAWHPPQAASTKAGARVSREGEVDFPTIGGGFSEPGAVVQAASAASAARRRGRWVMLALWACRVTASLIGIKFVAGRPDDAPLGWPHSGLDAKTVNDGNWVGNGP